MPFFQYEGINLYYEISGEGPPLFLINGLAGDVRQWEPLVGRLKSSFQIICHDMRCAGRSDKPDAPFSIEDIAEESRALISHLGHDSVSVLGFSMGGMVAMSLARRHSDIVRKMFLVSTAPSLKRPCPPSKQALKTFRTTDVSPQLFGEVYEIIFGSKYRKKVSLQDFIKFRMADENPQPAFAYLQQLKALEICDLFDEIKKISTPTVVIVGDEDGLLPPENSIWLNGHLSDSKLFTFNGVGHMVPLEAPDELADVLISNV